MIEKWKILAGVRRDSGVGDSPHIYPASSRVLHAHFKCYIGVYDGWDECGLLNS